MDHRPSPAANLRAGDIAILVSDEWDAENEVVVIDAEPVAGSTQCVIKAGDDMLVVSRSELRPV